MIEHYKDDISTVFSIVPFEIREFKPGLYPGNFVIPACLDDSNPQYLHVGCSEHLMTIGGRKEPTRVVTPSYIVAASIVRDFLDGQLWTTDIGKPGIAWVQGKGSIAAFVEDEIYVRIKKQQKNWFVQLCKQTDNEWKKQQSYRVVSDQARFAARYLGIEPEWIRTEEVGLTFNKCPACATMNDPQNAICSNCKCVLDKVKYEKLVFAS